MPWRLLRAILFRLPAETAHAFGLLVLAAAGRGRWTRSRLRRRIAPSLPELGCTRFGLAFENPIGLAAGFDKDARAVGGLFALGFGFVEVGTVTPRPQPGNPRPRLFRAPGDHALVNRMGFPNRGVDETASRLSRAWRPGPVGVNLGKNKDTLQGEAAEDYAAAFRIAAPVADYLVVNVSSPNTPALRRLQDPELLSPLLARVADANRGPRRPLLLKVSPDLTDAELEGVVEVATAAGIDGIIVTNTTVARPHERTPAFLEAGGLSGRPLSSRSLACLRLVRRKAGDRLSILAAGGIFDGHDAFERLRAGACLVQVYTGLVYGGPLTIGRMCRALADQMKHAGFRSLDELIGSQRT